MSGKDLRNFLYLNGISQDEAAKLLGVKRQTLNNWCNKEDLKGNILTKAKFIIDHFSAKISETNISGVVINGNAKDVDIKNDQRQFYSDSPDVLRAQIGFTDGFLVAVFAAFFGAITVRFYRCKNTLFFENYAIG